MPTVSVAWVCPLSPTPFSTINFLQVDHGEYYWRDDLVSGPILRARSLWVSFLSSWRYHSNFSGAGRHQVNYLDKNYSFLISTLSVKFLVAGASVLFIYFIAKLWTTGRREQGLPPGPPVTPVVGNALQFPTGFPHVRCVRVHPITVYSISSRCSLLLNALDSQNGHIRMAQLFPSVAYQPLE
jgi:hypothetical protein